MTHPFVASPKEWLAICFKTRSICRFWSSLSLIVKLAKNMLTHKYVSAGSRPPHSSRLWICLTLLASHRVGRENAQEKSSYCPARGRPCAFRHRKGIKGSQAVGKSRRSAVRTWTRTCDRLVVLLGESVDKAPCKIVLSRHGESEDEFAYVRFYARVLIFFFFSSRWAHEANYYSYTESDTRRNFGICQG